MRICQRWRVAGCVRPSCALASHLPHVRRTQVLNEDEYGSAAVRLLDAHWLIEYARRGGIILPRQELPEQAFMSLDELQAAGNPDDTLPIICLS